VPAPKSASRGEAADARTAASGSTNGAAGPTPEHRTVARVMSILELVLSSDPDGMRLADLSATIEAPKSTVHGLAKGLVATGYFREDKGRYFVGPAISSLLAVGPTGLPSMFHHVLEELTAKWDETSMIATLVGDSIVYLDSVEPASLIRAAPELNKRLSIWPRSSGKCFLAFMEPKRLEAYLRRNHPDPVDAAHVRDELSQIRQTHVGFNIGESVAGHLGMASPIINGDSAVTLAVAVVGPWSRVHDRMDDIAQGVREAAESLSRRPRSD
jgi:DNA-binding IclR family transcriptional regulator